MAFSIAPLGAPPNDAERLYDFVPLPARGPLRFPNGKRMAVIFTINLEYWLLSRDQKQPLFMGGPATIPRALPGDVPDYTNWTWREYGHRVGVWRLFELFDRAGIPPSCTMSAMMALQRRPIVEAVKQRGWELVAHNYAQNDLLSDYAYEPDQERDLIRRTLDVYADVVGRPCKAWLSSALSSTSHTPHVLKEFGLVAMCDYLNDDQPYLVYTEHGPLVCIPYSNDINDFALFARGSLDAEQGLKTLRVIFDELYSESATTGRIMNFGMHPHVMGQAHRTPALRLFLDYLRQFDDVWYPTREELAHWYLENHASHIPPRADAQA